MSTRRRWWEWERLYHIHTLGAGVINTIVVGGEILRDMKMQIHQLKGILAGCELKWMTCWSFLNESFRKSQWIELLWDSSNWICWFFESTHYWNENSLEASISWSVIRLEHSVLVYTMIRATQFSSHQLNTIFKSTQSLTLHNLQVYTIIKTTQSSSLHSLQVYTFFKTT